jgi:hypothetical protein
VNARVPTSVRGNIHPAFLAAPDDCRAIGEEVSTRLHFAPNPFTLEMIKRLLRGAGATTAVPNPA